MVEIDALKDLENAVVRQTQDLFSLTQTIENQKGEIDAFKK